MLLADEKERATLAEIAERAEKLRASGGECDCGRYGLFRVELRNGRVFTKAGVHGRGGIYRLGDGCSMNPSHVLADVKRLLNYNTRAKVHRAMTIYLAERYCGSEILRAEPEEILSITLDVGTTS